MTAIKNVLNIACLFFVMSGCTFAKHKQGSGAAESVTNICKDSVDYKVVHASLIQPKCLACHGAGSGLINLDTFEKVKNNIGRIQSAVQAGRMPPNNPLGENEKLLLTTWIDAGTPEVAATGAVACNSADGGGGVVPVPVLSPNYESIFKMILEPRCLSCHDVGSSLDFSTYAAITSHTDLFTSPVGEDGDFVEAVASGMMPPKKLPKLSPEEVDVLRQWVILGMPEKEGGAPLPPPVVVNPPTPPAPPAPVDPLPPELACMDFATIKATVLEPKCVGCHGGSGGVDLDSYAAVKTHLMKVDAVVTANKMPPKKPLDPILKDQLLNWIKDGAPETCEVPPVVEPLPPLEATYNSMKLHFLEAKCIICHDGSTSRKKSDDDNFDDNGDDDQKPDFSTYKAMVSQKWLFDFKKPHKSEIVDEVIDGDMPPPSSSAKPLTQIEIQTLIEWIKKGLPEG